MMASVCLIKPRCNLWPSELTFSEYDSMPNLFMFHFSPAGNTSFNWHVKILLIYWGPMISLFCHNIIIYIGFISP